MSLQLPICVAALVHRVIARVRVDSIHSPYASMKAQPILLGVAIASIAASVGYISVAHVRTSSNPGSSETEVASVGSGADSGSDLAFDTAEPTSVSSEPLLQSGAQSNHSSDRAAVVKTPASEPEFDASTGDSSIAALPSCTDAVTQTDMNICAHQVYETVDVTLNQTYQALTQELSTPEQDLLTDAELAWIEYRDKTCELEAAPYEGGTIQPLVYSQCLSRMTENRTAELQAHLDEISSR